MIEIPVLGGIKIAGFDYIVVSDLESDQELLAKDVWADHYPWGRRIRVLSMQTPQEWSNSFIHEVFEAIKCLYLIGELDHNALISQTNGWHQVLEGLGIRFVPQRSPEVKSC